MNFLKKIFGDSERVIAIACEPWGDVTTALNSMLIRASTLRVDYVFFQSIEVVTSAKQVGSLLEHMEEDTLIVGAALPGHSFQDGQKHSIANVEIGGLTTPWNTCSIWHRPTLSLT